MQRHGPNDFTGPLRGTTAWWHGTHEAFGHPPDSDPQPPSSSQTTDQDIRRDLVERVRREIAAGVYDTPEKWQAALDRMLQRLEHE